MLMARKASVWRSRYQISVAGRPVTTWDSSFWKSGGDFELEGQLYRVRGNAWGSRFGLLDSAGDPIAAAHRVGRRSWTVEAAGQTYHFQRASVWSNEQLLLAGRTRIGSVKRISMWRGDVAADLPGLPLVVQIFVLGVVITMWDAQAAATAAAS